MRRVRFVVIALAGVLFASIAPPAFAASDVEMSGQFRVRYEGSDRTFLPDAEFTHTVFQRTRFLLNAKNDGGAEVVIQGQDSRVWGDEGGTSVDEEGLDLHQGYAKVQDPFDLSGVDLIVGRQVLSYGNDRVIGHLEWANVGRAFDAARLRFNFDSNWVDVTSARVSNSSVAGVADDEILFYAVGHYEASGDANVVVEPLIIYRDLDTDNTFQTTFGGFAKFNQGRGKIWSDIYYQTGTSSGSDLGAYLFALDGAIDVSQDGDGGFGIGAGIALLSGDDPADDEDSAFDTLYHTGHRHYGYMDLADGLAGDDGLRDIHVKVWTKARSGISAKAALHIFSSDIDATLPDGDGNDIGKEIDLVIKGMLEQGMAIEVGGGIFLPGDRIEQTIGDETAFWGYLQGTTSF